MGKGSGIRADTLAKLVLAVLPFVLLFPLVNFTECDAFYHLRHASIYVQNGPFYAEFPWHTKSVIGQLGSDLWYGFHIVLIPFTFISDPMLMVKVASGFFLSLLLLSIYELVKREELPLRFLWPMLILGASYQETWRWLSMRPFLFSLGFAAWAFFFALRGQRLPAALCCLGISWIHASFFWIGPLVLGVVLFARGLIEKRWQVSTLILGILFTGVGLMARPNPVGGLELMKVQLVDLSQALRTDPYVEFGTEVYPLVKLGLAWPFVPFLAVWVVVLGIFAYCGRRGFASAPPNWRPGFAASLLLALGFSLLAIFNTYRAVEPCVLFAVLSMAYSLGIFKASRAALVAGPAGKPTKAVFVAVGSVFGSLIALSLVMNHFAVNAMGRNIYRLSDAMAWLKSNSREGDIVYALRWADFAETFFWNTKNRYVSGMDPIFMYAYDRGLFYKYTGIEVDMATSEVTAEPAASQPVMEDTHDALVKDFQARYVLATEAHNPRFLRYLRSDRRYRQVYSDQDAVLFEVL